MFSILIVLSLMKCMPGKRLYNRVNTRMLKSSKSKECNVFYQEDTWIYISDTMITIYSEKYKGNSITYFVKPVKITPEDQYYELLVDDNEIIWTFHLDADRQMFYIYENDPNGEEIEITRREYWHLKEQDMDDLTLHKLAKVAI